MKIYTPELAIGTAYTVEALEGQMDQIVEDLTTIYGSPTFGIRHQNSDDILGETDFSSVKEFPQGPEFMMTATHTADHTGVEFPELTSPGNCAAWAALRLYRSKLSWANGKESASLPDYLVINDHRGDLAMGLLDKKHSNPKWSATLHPSPPHGIGINYEKQKLLPGQLLDVSEVFKSVLPHRSAEASVVVGRLVGAKSVEVFCSAWAIASEKPDPAMAARTLLENPYIWLENSL